MRRTEDILYNVTGQSLLLRVLSGRPTSGTFKVFADTASDDSDEEFSGSMSVDTFTTTVDEASGPAQSNPRELHVASTTGAVIGRKYLIEENGLGEWFEPVAINSGDSLIGRYPLKRDYTTAATLKSTHISAAIDATWIADEANLSDVLDPAPSWRLRAAVINAAAATEIHYIFFDVVRAAIDHSVIMADLDARWPGLMQSLPRDHELDAGKAIVDAAWRSLRGDFAAIGINDGAMRDMEGLDEALLLKLRLVLAGGGKAPPNWDVGAFYQVAKDDFDSYFERNYQVSLMRAVATSDDGSADPDLIAQPFWSK